MSYSHFSQTTSPIAVNQIINPNETNQNEAYILQETNEEISISANSINNKTKLNETREIETLTDICSSDNIAEVDVISLLDENIPQYKLRADTIFSHSNCDWIRAPLYIDENEINELTNEQIAYTLDYFIQSGYRVSQMTKTYYDIEAVTRLLDEKERDLELAATIGKQLLEKDQQLEEKIEYLEQELVKTSEMVNQLKYEIQLKDNLLKSFIDSEQDCISDHQNLGDSLHNSNLTHSNSNKKLSEINLETLSEYKRKIEYLEIENEQLKNRADYFEKETADLETKESNLIINCFRELEESQIILKNTQDELKNKTGECVNQQEEINHLFSQIFELQSRIKNLTQDNIDLHSIYASSKTDFLDQIRELKEKYNECIQMLSKSQEEISVLRRRSQRHKVRSLKTSSTNQTPSLETFQLINDDDDLESSFTLKPKSMLYSPFMPITQPTNNTSFAAEVYSTMARNHQISQSNNFIKKVKQKLIKTIPGTTTSESCFQSEDENLNISINERKNLNCPTPDSILSTGSASIYSSLFRSNSYLLPEKLQIVKPIEGSTTLQHWQHLATPNLGCLFENRPGISIKGNSSDSNSDCKDDNEDEDKDSLLDEFEYDLDYSNYPNVCEDSNSTVEYKNRVLSPNKIELLTRLLEKEERIQNSQPEITETSQENVGIFGFIRNIFFNPIQEDSKSKGELADPDTPPSSPINLPENSFKKIVGSISNYFKVAPTPPATPTHELENEEIHEHDSGFKIGFIDQIFNKLKSFKSGISKFENSLEIDDELVRIEENKNSVKCSTPPPSPSKFSPPLPDLENTSYTEEDLKQSAFATVTKLNPFLNQQVDLSSLLKSLSSLKRNQRLGI